MIARKTIILRVLKIGSSHKLLTICNLRLPLEPSALRYITAFEIGEPFLYSYKDASSENAHKQLEFAVIKVRISILYSTIALLFKFYFLNLMQLQLIYQLINHDR